MELYDSISSLTLVLFVSFDLFELGRCEAFWRRP